ncbi:peptidoglycan DD-metalloendopeptidase family protein [Maricaulis sp. CAU 1757]
MRVSSLICLVAVSSAVLAACSTTPRQPARVDHRYPASTGSAVRTVSEDCRGGYTVRRNDTLSEIAVRCGVDMAELAQANSLYSPYTLRVGQSLSMPRPPVHVVQRGENLYRIGLRYGVPHTELARHNGMREPYALEVGQQIRLPQGSRVVAASSTSGRRPEATRTSASSPTRSSSPPAASGAPSFDWPVRGTILSNFGPRPNGERNDGINIEARAGTEVRASAPGQVVYAGNQLAGYGELVLIRHSGGFVTAYAHNSRIMVREGDNVERGQVIATAGDTGSVDRPQVHFEIRNGVTPVDPNSYLR